MIEFMTRAVSHKTNSLKGTVVIAGDKSISHRSLLLGSLALGQTEVKGLLESEDVLHLAGALKTLGVKIEKQGETYFVQGVGLQGYQEPLSALDMGNSGTAVRLLMGAVAGQNISAYFVGDDSLSGRPMGRVLNPLSEMGIEYSSRDGGRLPLTLKGTSLIRPIEYHLPVASAQVKSAILFAGLNAPGHTIVHEPPYLRDHTENMMQNFGATLEIEQQEEGWRKIILHGQPILSSQSVQVPSDPSSAAFFIIAALLTGQSECVLPNVCLNPTRTGCLRALEKMGAKIEIKNQRNNAGESIGDLHVYSSKLRGADIPADWAPSMIDEYPILSIAAAHAEGTSVFRGLEELRVKESDRFGAIVDGLTRLGVKLEEKQDELMIYGQESVAGGCEISSYGDHRIAMSFLVCGMVSENPIEIDDISAIPTSFPTFVEDMNKIGGKIDVL